MASVTAKMVKKSGKKRKVTRIHITAGMHPGSFSVHHDEEPSKGVGTLSMMSKPDAPALFVKRNKAMAHVSDLMQRMHDEDNNEGAGAVSGAPGETDAAPQQEA